MADTPTSAGVEWAPMITVTPTVSFQAMDSVAGESQGVASKGGASAAWERMKTVTPGSTGPEQQVEQRIYLRWIKKELDTESACLELPFTIILLLSFSCLAIGHLNQQQVFAVEQAVEFDILENANFAFSHAFGHKGLVDVHSFADFYSWLRLGFLPLIVQPSWGYSEDYGSANADRFAAVNSSAVDPPSVWELSFGGKLPVTGDYMRYNKLIGGIRFRQQLGKVGEDNCYFPNSADKEVWNKWYGKPCYPADQELAFTPDTSDSETFTDTPERVEWMLIGVDSLEKMVAKAVDMEDGCQQMAAKNRSCLCSWCDQQSPPQPWLTERTSRIEIGLATYNPQYGLITLTGVNLFFNRGSFIFKRVELMSSWIDLWSTPPMYLAFLLLCDAVWIISLLKIIIGELQEILHIARKAGRKCLHALYFEYLGAWNFVDWVSIIAATQAIVNFLTLQAKQSEMNEEFRHLITPHEVATSTTYTSEVEAFFKALEDVCVVERTFRTSLCFYPMVVMLRLFKSFAAQQRLAVVTESIANGYQDLVHFFIIFLSVFSCLCLDAVLLFGQDLEDYATFPRALHSCFRLMFGDWDWKSMENVSRISAAVWFWIFMLIIVMVMFNVLLAIIIESYTTVKKTSQNAPSLYSTMQGMRRRRKEFVEKKRVRLNDIWDGIYAEQKAEGHTEDEIFQSERLLTPSFIAGLVQNLPYSQAARTLGNAQKAHDKEQDIPLELPEAHERLIDLSIQVGKARDDIYETYTAVDHYDTMAGPEENMELEKLEEMKAHQAAIAQDLAMSSLTANESPVNDQVLDSVSSEVGRLTAEVASVLAQTMKKVDKKQNRLELRQKEMLGSIREMQTKLQMVQSDATGLTTRLQRYAHNAGRTGHKGTVMPSCLTASSAKQLPALPDKS